MAVWHFMFGMGFTVCVAVGLTLASLLANRPQSIEGPKSAYNNSTPDENCAICLCTLGHHITYLNCRHAFHDGCMKRHRENGGRNCPICRDRI